MQRIDHLLPCASLGNERRLSVFRYGACPRKAYIQASLHADELPGMRTALELKLRLVKEMYERLAENPLTEDQQLTAEADGYWTMTGRLYLSQGLKLWLLSQGDMLEVLAPATLRKDIAATAMRMATLYESA